MREHTLNTDPIRSTSMNRRQFMKLAGTGALASAAGACGASGPTPNVILITPSQMRAQAVAAMGNSVIQTPNLDKMARDGILLRNTFANSPASSPARASIQSGMYASEHGVVANDLRMREGLSTLGETFDEHGYLTGFIGKWHLDGGPREPGFVEPGARRQGYRFWAANECDHDHFNTHFFMGDPNPIPVNNFETQEWIDIAIDFISVVEDTPFFLNISMDAPHPPYVGPDIFTGMYDAETIGTRANWMPAVRNGSRDDIVNYYGMISTIDYHIGRLFRSLDELELAENTIVVFTSDHGDMLGSQGRRFARLPFEESIRVPGIVRWPNHIEPEKTTDAFVSHVDLAPTILGLCGISSPPWVQGRDLSHILLGESGEEPDAAFFQIFGPSQESGVPGGWRAVRTGQYLYATLHDRPWMLFDLEQDPYQMMNYIDDRGHVSVREDMHNRLTEWMDDIGDSWKNTWTFPFADSGELHQHKAFYSVQEYLSWARENPGQIPSQLRNML